jgi:hypothetical protein
MLPEISKCFYDFDSISPKRASSNDDLPLPVLQNIKKHYCTRQQKQQKIPF